MTMKSFLPFALCGVSALFSTVVAAVQPDVHRTRAYIDRAWSTLTRSMDDCSALGDSKVGTRPLLYLPADLPAPPALAAVQAHCRVEVRVLPRAIGELGEVDPATLPKQGLLYLPHPYVVPGGFLNEMYGWDSYFIVLGLLADQRTALARDMVDNALFEVQHYGAVLNANRSYYLTRAQPPFLGAMMRTLLDDPRSFKDEAAARVWLERAYPLAVRDHATWTRKEHLTGDTGLARYYDMDCDFVRGKPSGYRFVATYYPLWAGAASPQQAAALRRTLGVFERKGGLQTSDHASGAQWDASFGWAPTNWLAVAGLDAYGFHDDARRIARKFTATIDRSLAADGTMREKYNMASGNADVKISAGYTANVIGFGWSNGVYLKMRALLQERPGGQ